MAAANLPKLTVVKATYSKNSNNDVSEKVRALMAANGGNLIIAGNADFNNLFGDPEPKADKLFHLVYQYGAYGAQRSMTHAEKHVDIYLPALEIKPGQVLTVHVVKAIGLRDTRTLGKQNPYATLKCGSESFTTKAHEKGGTNADWNQSFIFNLDGKDQFMHVVVLDKETLSDSVIARFDIPLPTLAAAVGEIAYNLVHPNDFKKTAGSIVLKCEFRDPNAPKVPATPTPTAAAPATPTPTSPPVQQQPQVVYVQQPMQPQVVYAQPQPVMYQQPQVVYQQPQPVYQQPQPQPQVVYQQPQPTPQPAYVPQPAPQPVYTPPAAAAVSTSSSYDIPGWVFYPGKDINGNDHTNQPQNHGKNKFVIAAHCDQVGAVAFNTNGWVKHAIRGPPFDSFPNAGAGEGLYIKAQYAPASGAGSAAAAAPAYSAPAPSPYDIPGWVFYQGKDSSGNDHPNQPQNHGGNKFVLAAHCDQIGAVCFNTNGWCKTKCVGLPLHGFPNAQAHEGLYVKQGYLPQ